MRVLFVTALLVRLASVFVVQTSYVPDETWQCTEVAHKLVFGRGHLTWEWKEGLRSYLHPLLFSLPLLVLKLFGIDSSALVILFPRIFQALLCFAGDVLLYRLVVKLYGHSQATYTVIMQLSSWYLFYVTPRPLINNIETLLITATLNLWPTRYNDKVTYPAVILAALSVAIRPTLVLFWVFLGVHYLIKCPEKRYSSVIKAFVIGVPTLILTILLDSYMYGKLTVVFWNFLQFNMTGSAIYGAHPWHWYITQGVPAILGTHSIFIGLAFVKQRDYPRQFMGVVLATLLFFSLIAHKEFRFVQHLMPIFMIWAGLGLHWLNRHTERSTLYTIIMFNSLVNIIVAFYIGFFHQRGTISVVHDLASLVKPGDKVVFLTPCHATPFHSHIHADQVDLRFLDCSPDLTGISNYVHEEKLFYQDPNSWWERYNEARRVEKQSSEFVVAFENNLPEFHEILKVSGYEMNKRYFFAHLLVDDKLTSHLLLYKRTF